MSEDERSLRWLRAGDNGALRRIYEKYIGVVAHENREDDVGSVVGCHADRPHGLPDYA